MLCTGVASEVFFKVVVVALLILIIDPDPADPLKKKKKKKMKKKMTISFSLWQNDAAEDIFSQPNDWLPESCIDPTPNRCVASYTTQCSLLPIAWPLTSFITFRWIM